MKETVSGWGVEGRVTQNSLFGSQAQQSSFEKWKFVISVTSVILAFMVCVCLFVLFILSLRVQPALPQGRIVGNIPVITISKKIWAEIFGSDGMPSRFSLVERFYSTRSHSGTV
ncbi:hypothetical protein CDAR_529951 [Caerostris darwini]|uniref:ATP synthase F0 subunit 8 n=1 Tax=Caerostris darwini TaxID=1538125 RepID=A0AAV4S076_9ARAC|nr:hypothetical protein CDAR_529951 [Caerostris darwini]